MKSKGISTILRACALAALFVVGTQSEAFALPIVNFSTTAVFSGSGTNSITFNGGGSVNLTFTGVSASLDTPTVTSFGEIDLTTTGNFSGAASSNFTLMITQTAPSGGAGNLLGTVNGTIAKNNQSDFVLLFSTPFVTIGSVTYTLQQPPGGYFLVPDNTNNGVTSIQGAIAASNPVPEPTTMMLLGTGLLAAFRARRKKA